jgi:aspartyl-tRNA(Asn)/glutamyl-tRNA(Gln) amidotransferase subunit C
MEAYRRRQLGAPLVVVRLTQSRGFPRSRIVCGRHRDAGRHPGEAQADLFRARQLDYTVLEQITVESVKIDVSYVAELARLELTDSEKAVFQPQLESIVKYVEKISSVDVEGVEPMMHGRSLVNAFREDTLRESLDVETVLANAPKRVGDEFLLPKIVEGAES